MASETLPAVIERPTAGDALPAIITDAGDAACFVWDEFFSGSIRNTHTRRAYTHAVRRFLAWVADQGLELGRITPGLIGQYLDGLYEPAHPKAAHGRCQGLL